jgi:GWxTD domain-containing protein
MRHLLGILTVGVVLTLASPAPEAADVTGRGDFLFYLDTAAFLGRDGRLLEEVYVNIPNNEIKFVEADGQWKARLRLTVLIEDMEGKAVVQDAEDMAFTEDARARAESPRFFQTVIKRYRLAPGTYDLHYAVEDLQAPKMTLMGMVKDRNRLSAVRRFRLQLPEIPVAVPSFSEAKFLWSGERVGTLDEYHPNPARLYGLYRDTLAVYLELYLPEQLASASSFEFRLQVVPAAGEPILDRGAALGNPGKDFGEGGLRAYPVMIREDLSRVPAGGYTLYLSFALDGRLLHRARCGTFSVAWDMRTWEAPRRAYLAEARFLLGDKEYATFATLDRGEQERRLEAMWRANDPTPETDVNEAYEEFLVRLAYINTHYTDFGAGILSPRGRLYARYGAPDEIVQDYIPINRETIAEALEVVEDPYHAVDMSSHSTQDYRASPPLSNTIDPRNLAGERAGDHEAFPFELWVYTTAGEPILGRDRIQEMQIGMRYLFIDRNGYGRFKLESSSAISSK